MHGEPHAICSASLTRTIFDLKPQHSALNRDKITETSKKPTHMTKTSLTDLLNAREHRSNLCQQWQQQSKQNTLIVLTLVIPGPEKDSTRYRQLLRLAIENLESQFADQKWHITRSESFWEMTGSYHLWLIDASAKAVKKQCIQLEQSHPLGRLWDIDVLDQQGRPISRKGLSLPVRQCLICDQSARQCARGRSHTLNDLLERIDELLTSVNI
ncbi:MAG: apo-citrate lyase phosphoribosyl-dephospho-CoA transferase [Candidatus Celerinatantimonas neptuna]|nr:MAG: apo-citrate lyase phosphoribosyl-dephospho-CoA transferase [Candidatus Celerinatantimonas neptuna]